MRSRCRARTPTARCGTRPTRPRSRHHGDNRRDDGRVEGVGVLRAWPTTSPLEGAAGGANTGTTATSGSATPTSSNDLAVGFVAGHSNAQTIGVSSPGYIVQSQQTATSPSIATIVTGYQPLGAPTAQSFAGNFPAAMYWSSGVAFFRTAAGHRHRRRMISRWLRRRLR